MDLFKAELGDNLAGVYLHGSLAMGCFNPEKSDIDLLVVTHEKAAAEVYKRLARQIVALRDTMPNSGGMELSVILETYLKNFVYPTPFEFHFSDFHLERYRQDADYLCGGFEDADLAAHLTVVYHRGRTLYGTGIRKAFQPVDEQFYLQALLNDLEDVQESIAEKPVYYTLNLCRVLLFCKSGRWPPKKKAANGGCRPCPAAISRSSAIVLPSIAEHPAVSGLIAQSGENSRVIWLVKSING